MKPSLLLPWWRRQTLILQLRLLVLALCLGSLLAWQGLQALRVPDGLGPPGVAPGDRHSLLVGLALAGLAWLLAGRLLARALAPLQRLSGFARGLARWPGQQLEAEPGSPELDELQAALNLASARLGEQIEALSQSDARLQATVAAVPEALIGLDDEGRILMTNPALQRVFGLRPEQALGARFSRLMPGWDEPRLRRAAAGGILVPGTRSRVLRVEAQARRVDGTDFPACLALTETPEGGPLRYLGTVRDATEERAALAPLELAARALAAIDAGVLIVELRRGAEGRVEDPIVHLNAAAAAQTGGEAWDLIGQRCLALCRPEGAPADAEALWQALQAGPLSLALRPPGGRADRPPLRLRLQALDGAPGPASPGVLMHAVGTLGGG